MSVFEAALDTGGFIGGPMVTGFEEDYARYCDVQHAVGVSDGTSALRIAFLACGIQPGDVVLTAANTFIATSEAISQVGARPAFVDIDETLYNIDPSAIQRYIDTKCEFHSESGILVEHETGARVSAIVPVHLYGQSVDMDPILAIADRYQLLVVEDAAQAHGAEYFSQAEGAWRKAGSMGRAAAFSFYPGKNLGACGEAGAITTDDPEVAERARMIRDHGQSKKYYHDVEGYNGRLDAIQAGTLAVKLKHLAAWTEQRRESARLYGELLEEQTAITAPHQASWAKHVYHLYVVRVKERAALQRHLAENGIGTGIHYPIPLHLQKAYAGLGYGPGSFPVAERVAEEILSLPMFPGMSRSQQSRVVDCVLEFTCQNA